MIYIVIVNLIIITVLSWLLLKKPNKNHCNCDRFLKKEKIIRRESTKKQLLRELSRGRFEIYLQPKIGLQTEKTLNSEALIRYKDENGNIISPGEFVPYLEELELIHYLDLFVFEKVIEKLERWKRKDITISLNFSRKTVLHNNILDKVQKLMEKYDVDRKQIEIEITESMGYGDEEKLFLIANGIHNLGFKLSLDDFGSKFSNVFILSKLPFDTLKLDKSIVDNMLIDKRNKIIVEEFLETCKKLNIHSVAEGIETEAQDKTLRELGCDYGQGYLYDKPLEIEVYEKKYLLDCK